MVRTGLGISTGDAQTTIMTSRIRFEHMAEGAEEVATNRDMMRSTRERHTMTVDRV